MECRTPITTPLARTTHPFTAQPFSCLPMGGFPSLFGTPLDHTAPSPHITIPHVAPARKSGAAHKAPKPTKRKVCALGEIGTAAKRSKQAFDDLDVLLTTDFNRVELERKGVLDSMIALKTAVAKDISDLTGKGPSAAARIALEGMENWRQRALFYQGQLEQAQIQLQAAAFCTTQAMAQQVAACQAPELSQTTLPVTCGPAESELPAPFPVPMPVGGDIEAPPVDADMLIDLGELERLLSEDAPEEGLPPLSGLP